MKSFVFGCVMLLVPVQLLAQEVIGSQGNFSATSQGSLSWTFGEIVTETVSNGNGIFTQGFQQVILSDAALSELAGALSLEVYPNPFQTTISILTHDLEGEHKVTVIDVSGKTIYSSRLNLSDNSPLYQLDLSHLASGAYLLQLSSDSSFVVISRIVKY